MTIVKSLFACILSVLSLSAFCQHTDTAVFLKWKLKPGEVITYNTEMRVILDTSSGENNFFNSAFKNFPMAKRDSGVKFDDSWIKQMRKQMDINPGYVTTMTSQGSAIKIQMDMKGSDSSDMTFASLKKMFDTSAMKHGKSAAKHNTTAKLPDSSMKSFFKSAMFMLSRGVMLRGAINENGSLNSFYVDNEQRNLLGLFFSLPEKPVHIGDFWSPDVHLISETQNFICDSSSRSNRVTVTRIEYKDGQHIVTVKYDIEEYVVGITKAPFGNEPLKTDQVCRYLGKAKFSLEKGRWVYYDCLLSENMGGIVTSRKETNYTLSE